MAPHLTDKERERIVAYLKEGKSHNWIAGQVKRSQATVSAIASKNGIKPVKHSPKNANQARRDYAKAERLALLNLGFDKAEDLLKNIQEAKELQAWMIAVATAIDKRRVEDGQVSDRTENQKNDSSLEAEFAKLDAALSSSVEAQEP